MYQLCRSFILAYTFCVSTNLFSQTGHYKNGANAFARADASVTDSDSWSLFNNVGALADRVQEISVHFSSRNYYSIEHLFSTAAGINCPVGSFNSAIGVFRFGNELFNEQSILFGLGHQIGHTSIGIGTHYIQFKGEQIGKGECLAVVFGGITRINKALKLGACIFNISQSKISKFTGEKIPTVMNLGVEYSSNNGFMVNLEAEKEFDFNLIIRSGFEYAYKEKFFIRTGFSNSPFKSSYGFGIHSGRFVIDYGFRVYGVLGISHMISIEYRIKTS